MGIACVVACLIFIVGWYEPPSETRNYYVVVTKVDRIHEMIDLHQLQGYTPATTENNNDRRIDPRRNRR